MGGSSEYGQREVDAARSVLVELVHMLGEYQDGMVLIGGWVPYFLYGDRHLGSMDIDLALDASRIGDAGYASIREHLRRHGYIETGQRYQFERIVRVDDGPPVRVTVDFLTSEYGGTSRSHRHQPVQDILARKARGCELALQHNTRITIEGVLPDGGVDAVRVNICDVVPFLIMKGMALYGRLKEKDAWDIAFCIQQHGDALEGLAQEFRKVGDHGLVREGLGKIRSKFRTVRDVGPRQVADFEELTDPEERATRMRDVHERVSHLLDLLNVDAYEEPA